LADAIECCGAVVGHESGAGNSLPAFQNGFPVNDADNDGMLEFGGQVRDIRAEMRILKRKGSRRFGPDEEVGLLHTSRTAQTELFEFRHVGLVFGVPITRVLHILWKIRLNDTGDVAGRG